MAAASNGKSVETSAGLQASPQPSTGLKAAAIGALLLVLVCAYLPALTADFVSYDDDKYVTANPVVQQGLGIDGVGWAFTAVHDANWVPLVWISLMIDHDLYGLDPRGYHATNVVLHAISTLLLLYGLVSLTGAFWPSLFVAGLFALHPLHVQSVAWVSERKDTLAGLFWMATLVGYARYVARPGVARYAAIAVPFALGLLCKATLVTLPFALLLLDFWPARRFDPSAGGAAVRSGLRLVGEKVPLFALAAAASWVTLSAQASGGAMALGHLDLGRRIANAAIGYVTYLWKTLWPVDLAFFYPHAEISLVSLPAIGSAAMLVGVTGALLLAARRSSDGAPPLVGWLWYLGTLIPMIGLVQVGAQGMADRYTYLPLVGIGIVLAWGVPALIPRSFRGRGPVLATFAIACIGVWSTATYVQAGYWKDSESLYRRALQIDNDNYNAHYELARVLNSTARFADAEYHAREAVRVVPGWSDAYLNLGAALAGQGRHDDAVVALRRAVARDGASLAARLRLATSLIELDRRSEARLELQRILEMQPHDVAARLSLASLLHADGDLRAAVGQYQLVMAAVPGTAESTLAAARIAQIVDAWESAPRAAIVQAREFADALAEIEPDTFEPIARRLSERSAVHGP